MYVTLLKELLRPSFFSLWFTYTFIHSFIYWIFVWCEEDNCKHDWIWSVKTDTQKGRRKGGKRGGRQADRERGREEKRLGNHLSETQMPPPPSTVITVWEAAYKQTDLLAGQKSHLECIISLGNVLFCVCPLNVLHWENTVFLNLFLS